MKADTERAGIVAGSDRFRWGFGLAWWLGAGILLSTLLLCSCMAVGPDFVKPPDPVEQEQWLEADNEKVATDRADYGTWWKVFDDPVLDELVERASQQNLSLRIAGLRVLEARAQRGIAVGYQYPQAQSISGGYSISHLSRNAAPIDNLPSQVRDGVDTSVQSGSVGLDAAWELDFWGKFRRGVESADASLAASIADYDSFLVILVGEVAATYVVIRTLEARLEVAKHNVEVQREGLKIARVRFEGGATTELDVEQARTLLANTQALIPVLQTGLRQAKNALSILLGMPPSDLQEILKGPGAIPAAPMEVAVGIPAELMRRRPDVRLAEFQAAAQSAQIGVAKADMYPHFALAGTVGFTAEDMAKLFTSGSLTGSFTPFVFRWDILNYGRIKNKVRIQDARFEQLLVNYQNTVLKAAKEVEDGLVGFLQTQEQVSYLAEAEQAAKRAVELALLQYREGSVDYTRVLNTQQSLLAQQDGLTASRGDVDRYLIAVYKALGGGWEIRKGKDFIPEETAEAMRNRTNWGKLLDSKELPEELEPPPTGKDVKLFNKPDW